MPDGSRAGGGRRRVLQVVHALAIGGMERVVVDLVRGIDPRRFELHVITLQLTGELAPLLHGVACVHAAPPMERWSMIRPAALADTMRRINPDVVHTHGRVWYKSSLAAQMARVPRVVHTEHGRGSPDPWKQRLVDRLAAHRTHAVAAVSESLASQLRRTVVGNSCEVRVVTNGVDTDAHAPVSPAQRAASRARLGIAPETPVIGSIGRFERIKGFDILVDAFAHLHRTWAHSKPRPALVIIGDGAPHERTELEARIEAHGLRDAVVLTGAQADVRPFRAAFSVFSLGSRSEGTSISLLESMSAGLCPVVTRVGGNAAVVGPALAHRLVAPLDPKALAAAWVEALGDDARRALDGCVARDRVCEAFSLRHMVRAYEALYDGDATSPDRVRLRASDSIRRSPITSPLGVQI